MDKKRNRLWRQRQQMRVFKARMMYFSACGHSIRNDDGSWNEHPHWFEIARERWAKAYRTTVAGFVGEKSITAGNTRKKVEG